MQRKSSRPNSLEDDFKAIERQQEKVKAKNTRLDRTGTARESFRKRKIILGILAVVLLAIVIMAVDGFRQIPGERDVEIASFQQPTLVWHTAGGAPDQARMHQVLANGDLIRTGPRAGAALLFPDGSLVKIGQGTTFRVSYSGYNRRTGGRHREFQLLSGRIWARVSKFASGDSSFNVTTPTALAGVRGTRFTVGVGVDGSTLVSLKEGEVSLEPQNVWQRSILHPDQQAVVTPGMSAAPMPAAINQSETQAWQAQQTDPAGDILAVASGGFRPALTNFEEQFLVRPIAIVAGWLHLDAISGAQDEPGYDFTAWYDAAALTRATAAARALRTAMEAANDPTRGYPATVGLADLSGLSLTPEQANKILDDIEGKRLLSYHSTGNSFTLFLRAKRPSEALIQVVPDSIKPVPDVTSS